MKNRKIENSPIREDVMQVIFHKTVPALICGGSTEDARKIFITQFRKNGTIDRQKKLLQSLKEMNLKSPMVQNT